MSVAPVKAGDQWETAAVARPASADRKEVAREFEALLLTQLLRGMREAGQGGGWLGTDGDSSLTALSEMGEQLLARAWSQAGGAGLAGLLEEAFRHSEESARSPSGRAAGSTHAG
jgi:Rod binding domain-containing protein